MTHLSKNIKSCIHRVLENSKFKKNVILLITINDIEFGEERFHV